MTVGGFEVEGTRLDTLRVVRNNAQASVIETKSEKIRQWYLQKMANQHPDHTGVRNDTDLARRFGLDPRHLRNDTFLQVSKALASRGSEVGQILSAGMPKVGVAFPYTVSGYAVPLAEVNFSQFPTVLNTFNAVLKDDFGCFGGPLQVTRPYGDEGRVFKFYSPGMGLQTAFPTEWRIRLSNEAIDFRSIDRPMAHEVEGRHGFSDDCNGRVGGCRLSRR